MTRTTRHDLEVRLNLISGYLGRPEYGWRRETEDGQPVSMRDFQTGQRVRNIATVGALTFDRSYGGWRLHEVVTDGGGVREWSPRLPAGQMALFLDGMLASLRLGEDGKA